MTARQVDSRGSDLFNIATATVDDDSSDSALGTGSCGEAAEGGNISATHGNDGYGTWRCGTNDSPDVEVGEFIGPEIANLFSHGHGFTGDAASSASHRQSAHHAIYAEAIERVAPRCGRDQTTSRKHSRIEALGARDSGRAIGGLHDQNVVPASAICIAFSRAATRWSRIAFSAAFGSCSSIALRTARCSVSIAGTRVALLNAC